MPARSTLTVREVAERLGVSPWAVYEAVRRGDFPVPPIRVGRKIVFPRTQVDRLLGLEGDRRGQAPDEESPA